MLNTCDIRGILDNPGEFLSKQWDYEVLGLSPEGRPILCVTSRNRSGRKIGVAAGIHGDEPAPVLAVFEFLMSQRTRLQNQFVVFPLVNPDGFFSGQHFNAVGINVNRGWYHHPLFQYPQSPEAKLLVEKLKIPPDYFISLHEDTDQQVGSYMYIFNEDNSPIHPATEKIQAVLQGFYPPIANQRVNDDERIEFNSYCNADGLCLNDYDTSLEDYMYSQMGVPATACTETPASAKADLAKRVRCNWNILNQLANMCW